MENHSIGNYVAMSTLIFTQVVFSVDQYWTILPCWLAVACAEVIVRVTNGAQLLNVHIMNMIIFASASLILVNKSRAMTKNIVLRVRSENKAISLQHDSDMLVTRMNDMRLLVGNISHDLKTPVI